LQKKNKSMKKLKIVFFTGAGISEESGLSTFRSSSDGLWNNYKIEDVCTPEAWRKNPALVLEFYNKRRKQCLEVSPNLAHELIAQLQEQFEVVVVTQNVDDLHERAGAHRVLHLHGELMLSRSSVNRNRTYPCDGAIEIGDLCEEGSQLRPHIVWFGELLDDDIMNESINHIRQCDICVVVGSSMQVSPANSIPYYLPSESKLIVIDPDRISFDFGSSSIEYIQKKAVEGMQQLYSLICKEYE
jgi:NAD-dependent deacetylase